MRRFLNEAGKSLPSSATPKPKQQNACVALEPLDFEDLPLGFGLGASREVFTDAFAVQPAGDAENDLPGGIRES
jgi:hypothetical protein